MGYYIKNRILASWNFLTSIISLYAKINVELIVILLSMNYEASSVLQIYENYSYPSLKLKIMNGEWDMYICMYWEWSLGLNWWPPLFFHIGFFSRNLQLPFHGRCTRHSHCYNALWHSCKTFVNFYPA